MIMGAWRALILAGILALAFLQKSSVLIFSMMIAYSLGFSILLIALAFGIVAAKRLPRSGNWLNYIKIFSAVLLGAFGLYFFYRAFNYL